MSPRNMAILAFFLGPAACAADQLASYALVYSAAASGSKLVEHLLTVAAAVVAGTGLLLARRVLRSEPEVASVDRFLAIAGMTSNAFFLLVVLLGFGIPKLVLHPTD